jgi:hypothetical protein
MQPRRLPLRRLWQWDQAHPHEVLAKREHYCIDGSLNRWLPYKTQVERRTQTKPNAERGMKQILHTVQRKAILIGMAALVTMILVLFLPESNVFLSPVLFFLGGGSSKSQETSLLAFI